MRRLPLQLCALLVLSAALPATTAPGLAADPPGLRTLESKHLTLVTDLPASAEIDALPEQFDQAFPQWCAYFGVDAEKHADWKVRGYLIGSRERFRAAGLLPADWPEFPNGFSSGDQLWLMDQTSGYYRRHLLLHEGTHAFMHMLLGKTGPTWLAEGLAELLATHRLVDGQVQLNDFPRERAEVPKWGRIDIVQSAYAARQARSLDKVLGYDPSLRPDNDAYGWCWALIALLDGHPRYRERFRNLMHNVAQPDFLDQLKEFLAADPRVYEDWQLLVANLDYGYDFARMEFEPTPGKPLSGTRASVQVAADRGWQSTGIELEPGKTYRLRASGRYQVAGGDKPWQSEPGGVTIRYEHGQPLGKLLAAVRTTGADPKETSGLIKPAAIGLSGAISVKRPGTLYLRINDSPGGLADNQGQATVEITQE